MSSSKRTGDQMPPEQDPVISDEEMAAQEELAESPQATAYEPAASTGQLERIEPPSEGELEGTAAVSYPIKGGDEPAVDEGRKVTRAGMVWAGTITALILLVLLIIFIAQNQDVVTLRYFNLVGQFNLGLALLLAAVGGGILAAIAGGVRIIQLHAIIRRLQRNRR